MKRCTCRRPYASRSAQRHPGLSVPFVLLLPMAVGPAVRVFLPSAKRLGSSSALEGSHRLLPISALSEGASIMK